jgi:prepilin-type processing-associated H-X9-DG protein
LSISPWSALRAGDERLDYLVPNVNQCANCHTTDTSDGLGERPIGPKARHLNRDFAYADGHAEPAGRWTQLGLLEGAPDDAPAAPAWTGGPASDQLALNAAARAYLDINCAHCHSRTGQADTSGLYLEPWEPESANLGLCKPPIAAGRGAGATSIPLFRARRTPRSSPIAWRRPAPTS